MSGTEYRHLERMIETRRKELNALIARKKVIGEKLLEEMDKRKVESFQGVSKGEVYKAPKEKKPSKAEKRDAMIAKLRQMGLPNPQAAVDELGL